MKIAPDFDPLLIDILLGSPPSRKNRPYVVTRRREQFTIKASNKLSYNWFPYMQQKIKLEHGEGRFKLKLKTIAPGGAVLF